MPDSDASLWWENLVVITVVRALLGRVSPPLLGVSVDVTPTVVTLLFAIHEADDEINDDISHIVAEVRRLLAPDVLEVHQRIQVGPIRWPTWEGYHDGRRLVYASKDSHEAEDASDGVS